MREVFIGEYIRHRRKELGMTQKQLCSGICEPITISRLENGKQTPSRNVISALLQRLDLPNDRYFALLSKYEAENELLVNEITTLSIAYQRAPASEKNQARQNVMQKITRLEQIVEADDKITQQFILRTHVLLGHEDGSRYDFEEELNILLSALRITVPQFELTRINDFIYCLDEVKIINQIAGIYTCHNRHLEAADILSQLLSYVQNHFHKTLFNQGHLPMIATNYARTLNLCGQNKKALDAAEAARQACIAYKNYQMLPRILHVMALIYHDLENDKKSKQLYYQAYHVCMAIDDNRDLELLQTDAREQYGIEFEEGPLA